ncbi:MAG: alanine racemase, partial [Oscillospiraceae bacterium]|nr:alanine racemase [Oscillospiraceae bacterium]
STQERQNAIEIMQKIHALKHLEIDGIFTHFSVADEPDPKNIAYTVRQKRSIIRSAQMLQEKNIPLRHVHFLNSAGICYHNKTGSDSTLARAGIIMYGLMPNPALAVPIPVKPVLSFYSRISHIKTIRPGDCVSYGRTYKAESARRIATVTIGYADGYPRALSNQGEMLVRGIRCPIVGRVCMDQTMIDISAIPEDLQKEIQPGEIVTLIGQDGEASITADDIAGLCSTIGYEIVCGISKRIPRIFKENARIIHEDHLI